MPTSTTSVLTVLTFPAPDGAPRALRVLERAQRRREVVVGDCAVVEWPAGRLRPTAYQVGTVDGATELSGAFWGMLVGSLFLAPLAGLTGPVWPPDGLARIGLPESLLAELRARIGPGTSALFVFGAAALEPDPVGAPSVVETILDGDQEARLRRAFGTEESG